MEDGRITAHRGDPEPVVRVHPEAAGGRNLTDGEVVFVESQAGRVLSRLRIDADVRTDVLLFNPAACSIGGSFRQSSLERSCGSSWKREKGGATCHR